MKRSVETVHYFYVYDNDKSDIIFTTPSSSDQKKQNNYILNCIEEARKILRRNPDADIDICGNSCDLCNGYECGEEYSYTICDKNGIDSLEQKVRNT